MTSDSNNHEDRRKGAPKTTGRDPRILAFVRLLARHAAEEDYAHHLRTIGKAPNPLKDEE